jgi:phosphatidylinositol-3-phosphatase
MRRAWRFVLGVAAALGALAGPAAAPAGALPPIKHVFVIVLENKAFSETFSNTSGAPYLSQTLVAQGGFVPNYWGIAHESLPNYLAMLSGQAANPQTQADAQFYTDFMPGTPAADGQVMGQGAVYPAQVKTLADQLRAQGLTWKGYMEDMGNSATEPKTCRHPTIGSQDHTQSARAGDQYAARHNPFVYFHSIIDDQALCDANDVPLDRLPGDLASASQTPNFAFITPNLCNDGHDKNCVDGRPGGLVAADAFLRTWVPRITGSPAYQRDGLLLVLFDEAPAPPDSGTADASACPAPCQSPAGPNTVNPGGPIPGAGGGLVGAVALSPYIRPGTIDATPYNHYSFLRSVEDLFGLGHVGYAGLDGQTAFGSNLYTGTPGTAVGPTSCSAGSLPVARRGRLPRGSVIRTAVVRHPPRRSALLDLRFTRAAGLSLLVRSRPVRRPRARRSAVALTGAVRRVGPRRVVGCRFYRLRLPYRHGTLTVAATVGRGSERRTIRF